MRFAARLAPLTWAAGRIFRAQAAAATLAAVLGGAMGGGAAAFSSLAGSAVVFLSSVVHLGVSALICSGRPKRVLFALALAELAKVLTFVAALYGVFVGLEVSSVVALMTGLGLGVLSSWFALLGRN